MTGLCEVPELLCSTDLLDDAEVPAKPGPKEEAADSGAKKEMMKGIKARSDNSIWSMGGNWEGSTPMASVNDEALQGLGRERRRSDLGFAKPRLATMYGTGGGRSGESGRRGRTRARAAIGDKDENK